MEVDNVPDTGQKDKGTSSVLPPTRDASNAFINPVGPQNPPKTTSSSASLVFDKSSLTQGLTQSPSITTSDLGSFAKKRARTNTPGLEAGLEAADATGTPRSQRIKNLFPEKADSTSLKEMVSKLLEVVKDSLPLAGKNKSTKKIQVDVDTAANILVLTGAVYDQFMYEDAKRNFTTPDALMNPTQRPRNIVFKGRETEDKLDLIVALLSKSTGTIPAPSQKTTAPAATSSYALAASKHAPSSGKTTTMPVRPNTTKAQPQQKPRTTNAITLVHEAGAEITHPHLSTAKLIQEINLAFRAYNIKMKPEDTEAIEAKSVRRHPSNDIEVYFETPAHAAKVRSSPKLWLQGAFKSLKLKEAKHEIIVNGIPTTFNPELPDHREELQISNSALLKGMTSVRWLNPRVLEDPSKRYSSILIGLSSEEEVQQCVAQKIWHGRGKHQTFRCGPPPQRCYNCQKPGHTASNCPIDPICPFCGDNHHTHTCPQNGKTEMKCTACARHKTKLDPSTNIKTLFKANHADFVHHPFSPHCPTRIAASAPPHNPSSSPYIVIVEDSSMNTSK